MLQGMDINKSEYALLANHLATAGLWVAVPNCIPLGRDYFCPDAEAVLRVHNHLLAADVSGLRGAVGQGLLLLGHSAGGMAALEAVMMVSSDLMRDLRGVVTYGANALFKFAPGAQMPPCLIIAGSQDGIVPADLSYQAYQRLPCAKKVYVQLTDLNHYGITHSAAPKNAPDETAPASVANEASVRYVSALAASFAQLVQGITGDPEEIPRSLPPEVGRTCHHLWS